MKRRVRYSVREEKWKGRREGMQTQGGETLKSTLRELVVWYAGIRAQLHVGR